MSLLMKVYQISLLISPSNIVPNPCRKQENHLWTSIQIKQNYVDSIHGPTNRISERTFDTDFQLQFHLTNLMCIIKGRSKGARTSYQEGSKSSITFLIWVVEQCNLIDKVYLTRLWYAFMNEFQNLTMDEILIVVVLLDHQLQSTSGVLCSFNQLESEIKGVT